MRIEGIDPETKKEFVADVKGVNEDFIQSMSEFSLNSEDIKKTIDNLDISADAKSTLYKFSKATVKIGEFVVKIGRKILDFICILYKEYPNAVFGLIFGAIAGFLISTIPVLGALLAALVTPLAMVFSMMKGAQEDIKDKKLNRKIAEINAKFSPLMA